MEIFTRIETARYVDSLETLFASVKAIEAEEIKRALWENSLQGYEEEMKQIGIKEEKQ